MDANMGKITKRRKSDTKQERKFFRRCNECVNCKRVECGQCKHCLDMPKFGGSYKLKKACVDRECIRSRQDNPVLHGVSGRGGSRSQRGVSKLQDKSNKGKYYIIPNRPGEIYQVQTLTNGPSAGGVQVTSTGGGQVTSSINLHSAGTRVLSSGTQLRTGSGLITTSLSGSGLVTSLPGSGLVTSSQNTATFIPTFVPATTTIKASNNIDLKPRPSLSIVPGQKPGHKVYTCSLATPTTLQAKHINIPTTTTTVPTSLQHRTINQHGIAVKAPTVNISAAKQKQMQMADESPLGGGGSTPTTPTNVEQTASNLDIDDFVNKYLKVYYEDTGRGQEEDSLEEFGLEVIADIKFHPSGGGCESFWGEGASDSSSDPGDTRWKDYDDTDLELGLSKLLEYDDSAYTSDSFYRSNFCQFCTLNSKCGSCLMISSSPKQISTI